MVRRPDYGRRRRNAVRTARARVCGARLRRRLFPAPRAALPAVAAGGASRRAARAVRRDRAARAHRGWRADAALDVCGAANRRCADVADALGAAAISAAADAVDRETLSVPSWLERFSSGKITASARAARRPTFPRRTAIVFIFAAVSALRRSSS